MNRKTLAALILATALPAMVMAGGHGGPDSHSGPESHAGRPGHGGIPILEDLDLSKEQSRDIRKLVGEEMKSRHEITKRYLDKLPEAEKAAMKKEMDESRDKTRASIRNLLTPEQQKEFDEKQKKIEAKRQEYAEFLKWKAERDQKH
ncbi:Spy/CpxP family protein refolding chaperone [Azomonas macrocytogenes]|uniref:Spy/CpxP family protein refolding chaperone n=1 Tax=Azomonas macrocytogenes TaxID=69962 RepID=A0A839T2H3_AZOMA|nr:Spy/CpxP family protein refolding chaperone [Azomonas macrocytogenes]MBB3103612.1 Spy/CpxP family protein refolding chaperone [Azomonas macrocytogenes]